MCLESREQDRALPAPQPSLQMMADAAGVAHSTCGNDDMEAGEPGDRLALINGFREVQLTGSQKPVQIDARIETGRVIPKDFRRTDRQRRIEENWCGRNLTAGHQVGQIDDQLLGPFYRKSGD